MASFTAATSSGVIGAYSLLWICLSDLTFDMTSTSPALLSPAISSSLVIAPNSLRPGVSYTFQLTLKSADSSGQISSSQTSFSVNQVPNGGSCSISPLTGVTLQTIFTFTCQNWADAQANLPLSYSLGVYDTVALTSSLVLASAQVHRLTRVLFVHLHGSDFYRFSRRPHLPSHSRSARPSPCKWSFPTSGVARPPFCCAPTCRRQPSPRPLR